MKFRDYKAQEPAELELAPMIDVVFLLLIFFLVTWQFARFERDMDVSVPAAENAEKLDKQVGEIIINVRKDGDIVLNNVVVSDDDLAGRLKAISEAYPDQAVILRGDGEAKYQSIIGVLDLVKKAGIWNVAFATVRPEEPK
jgi:biopolymer transport protein ExbD